MKLPLPSRRSGFTLLEMSVAVMMSIVIGAMVIALSNQQLFFMKLVKQQNFLTEEAPIISTYVSKVVGKADRFRLHASVQEALLNVSPRGPLDPASPVVVLNFRQPDGTVRASLLAFENLGSGNKLHYYLVPPVGNLGSPQWVVTEKAKNVAFSIDQGVLRMTLTGPADEQITFSGSMQQ